MYRPRKHWAVGIILRGKLEPGSRENVETVPGLARSVIRSGVILEPKY